MMKHKGILETAGLVSANIVTWSWKKLLGVFDVLIEVDYSKLHEVLGCVFTALSIVYLLYKWSKDGSSK